MTKRSSQSGMDSGAVHQSHASPFTMETMLTSSLRRRLSSPGLADKHSSESIKGEKATKTKEAICKQIEGCRQQLLQTLVRFHEFLANL